LLAIKLHQEKHETCFFSDAILIILIYHTNITLSYIYMTQSDIYMTDYL